MTGSTAQPEILAPTPRRHLVDSSTSREWLRTPPLSPISSRAGTPASVASVFSSSSPVDSFRRPSLAGSMLERRALKNSSSYLNEKPDSDGSGGLAKRSIRWFHKRGLKDWVVPTAIMVSMLVKLALGLGSYSGHNTPPMFGDYEAQRHWMELTLHLQTRNWYTYDLGYWGLDYPPLTAYVSWMCGVIGSRINPSWFQLDQSRGIESSSSKLYMRMTVVVLDALVYVPALWLFVKVALANRSTRSQNLAFVTLLFQPSLLLIDFGHFQYNSVMLGLTTLCITLLYPRSKDTLAAICFSLSLGFKQMALYYAPAIGTYFLAKCLYLGPQKGFKLLLGLGVATLSTFVLMFLPWLPLPFVASFTHPTKPFPILDPIIRIFPLARGLFEDKVANFWCFTNVLFIKYHRHAWATTGIMVKLSTALTLLGFLPVVVMLLFVGWKHQISPSASTTPESAPTPPPSAVQTPTASSQKKIHFPVLAEKPAHELSATASNAETATNPMLSLLLPALLTSSLSFFLFSFQVHEKSFLLPLLPLNLLMCSAVPGSSVFEWGALVNNAAAFSVYPLLQRDGQSLQYFAVLLLWNRLIGYNPWPYAPTSLSKSITLTQLLSVGFHSVAILHHILWAFVPAPARLPDLYPVLTVLICTPVFGMQWLVSIKWCLQRLWAIGGLGSSNRRPELVHQRSSTTSISSAVLARRSLSPEVRLRPGAGSVKRRISSTSLLSAGEGPKGK